MGALLLLYIGGILGIIIFLIIMILRFVRAQEQMARHMLEITRDFKNLSHHLVERDKK